MTKRRKYGPLTRYMVFSKYSGHCAYCGCLLDPSTMTIDHFVPISMTGSNELYNLMPSCRDCNALKSSRTVDGFREAITCVKGYDILDKYGLVKHMPIVFYFEEHKEFEDGFLFKLLV